MWQILNSAKVAQCDETNNLAILVDGKAYPAGGGGASSWDDLQNKPFGEFPTDTMYWNGIAAGLPSDNFWGYPLVKVSDAKISRDDLFDESGNLREIKVTGIQPDGGHVSGYAYEATPTFSDDDFYIMVRTDDGKDEMPLGIIYTENYSGNESMRGVWFLNVPSEGYFDSLTIVGRSCFTEVKQIDAKYLPGGGSLQCATFTDRPSLYEWLLTNYNRVLQARIVTGEHNGTFSLYADLGATPTFLFSMVAFEVDDGNHMTRNIATAVVGPDSTSMCMGYASDLSVSPVAKEAITDVLPDEYWSAMGVSVMIYYW